MSGSVKHIEYDDLSARAGYAVRRAGIDAILTDTQVQNATSADDLITNAKAVSAGPIHQEYAEFEPLETVAGLSFGKAIGDFSDTRVQAATGVENLSEQTSAGDEKDLGHLGGHVIG